MKGSLPILIVSKPKMSVMRSEVEYILFGILVIYLAIKDLNKARKFSLKSKFMIKSKGRVC